MEVQNETISILVFINRTERNSMTGENRKFKSQEQETIKLVHLVCDFHKPKLFQMQLFNSFILVYSTS